MNFENYIGLIILTLSILSCESKNVNGHYHVTDIKYTDKSFFTIDIINDTLASIGRNSFYQERFGYHNKNEKELDLPGDCGSGHLKYEIIKNGLLFTGRALGGEFIGLKCDTNCCSKIEDYFNHSQLDIRLPIIPKKLDSIGSILNKGYYANILIGKPQEQIKNFYGDTTKISLGGSFANISEIELWVEKHKIKIPKDRRHRLIIVIYADLETETQLISKVVAELRKLNMNKILFSYLNRNQSKGFPPFKVVNINKLELYKKK